MKNLKYLFIAALAIFGFNACEDVPEPYNIPELSGAAEGEENIIFEQSFASSLGEFQQTNTNDELYWGIDYSSACISGHEKVNGVSTYKAGESYLVSPAIDLSTYESAHLTMNHVICYADNNTIKDCHKVLVSTDYAGDATKATWIATDFEPVGSSSFSFNEVSFNLPQEVMGQKAVYIAFYYKSTSSKASTWEIKSISIEEGEATEEEEAKEMTVAEAIAAYEAGTTGAAIVKGYIVGWNAEGEAYDETTINFNGTASYYANVIIADSPDETDITKCIPVQLPSGAVRNKVNLKDNPSNYKKFVYLTGSLEAYFKVAGLKSVSKALFEGEEEDDNTNENVIFEQSFASSLGEFQQTNTNDELYWGIDYSSACISGHEKVNGVSTYKAGESYLVSPAIDLSGYDAVHLTMNHVICYADNNTIKDCHKVLVSTDYAGDATKATWIATDFEPVGSSSFTFNEVSFNLPKEVMGQKAVYIAFYYKSTSSKASTWEIKNVVVAHGVADSTGGSDTPTTGGTYIEESFATSFGSFTTQQTVANYPWVIDYSCAQVTAYESASATNNAAESWLVSPEIDFTSETEAYIAFDYVIRYTQSGKVADHNQLLISANYTGDVATTSWTTIDYNATEGTSWTFSNSGKIAIPAEFMGKKVRIAFKYTATSEKAGTWEVKNLIVAHGAADSTGGSGTLTVAQLIAAYNAGTTGDAIVTGYIVGTVASGAVYNPIFGTENAPNTNLLLADSPTETDGAKCIPVQLPTGAVRTEINLKDNPSNLGRKVTLEGKLEKYFGKAGLKSTTSYTFE